MRWPWSKPDPNRGTFTLLPDGLVIIGTPGDITQSTAHGTYEMVRLWLEAPEPKPVLVFPFPVDVVDKRR